MKQHANLGFIRSLIMYEEVLGRRPSDAEAIGIIEKLPRRLTLGALSSLAVLTARLTEDQKVQVKLVELLCPEFTVTSAKILSLLQGDSKRMFLYPPQVAAATALVCKYSPDSTQRLEPADFLKFLLLVNSFVAESPSDPGVDHDVDALNGLMITEVRSISTAPTNVYEYLWRYKLLMDWEPTKYAPKLPNRLADEFHEVFGATYDDYFTATTSILAHAATVTSGWPLTVFTTLALDENVWLASVPIKGVISRFLELNSTSPEDAGTALASDTLIQQARNWRASFLRTPLVRIAPDQYSYAHFGALVDTLGRSMFSRLLEHYNKTYGKSMGNNLLNYYGRFLEDYVFTLFQRSIKKEVIRDDIPFKTSKSTDNRIVDTVVVEPPEITFVEVTAKRFNLTGTIIEGDIESLDRDLQQMVVAKAGQIAQSIERFSLGELESVRVKPADTKRVHAILVLQEFPQFAALRRHAMRLVVEAGICLDFLQIVTVDELELIESALRHGFRIGDIMKRKSRHSDHTEMSLRNFALTFWPNLIRGIPADIEAEHKKWYDTAGRRLEDWGLGHESVAPVV